MVYVSQNSLIDRDKPHIFCQQILDAQMCVYPINLSGTEACMISFRNIVLSLCPLLIGPLDFTLLFA